MGASPTSSASSRQCPPLHSAGVREAFVRSSGSPSQTPLQPDWLSRQSTRKPARTARFADSAKAAITPCTSSVVYAFGSG